MPGRLVPFALYVGRDHILTDANETWRDLYVGPVPIGCPAREVFRGKMGQLFVEALDRARDTGEDQRSPCPDHESFVVITPLLEGSRVVGLVSCCGLERLGPMLASLPAQSDQPSLELSA